MTLFIVNFTSSKIPNAKPRGRPSVNQDRIDGLKMFITSSQKFTSKIVFEKPITKLEEISKKRKRKDSNSNNQKVSNNSKSTTKGSETKPCQTTETKPPKKPHHRTTILSLRELLN